MKKSFNDKEFSTNIQIYFAFVLLIFLFFMIFLFSKSWEYWSVYHFNGDNTEIAKVVTDRSAIIRNIALIFLSGLAIVLALWRGFIAERQTSISNQQHEISERTHRDTSFKTALEMLDSEAEASRVGGLLFLREIANFQPYKLSRQILTIYNTFINQRLESLSKEFKDSDRVRLSQDVLVALGNIHEIIKSTPHTSIDYDGKKTSFVDLDLAVYPLTNHKLNDMGWYGVNFNGGYLTEIEFTDCIMNECSFKKTELHNSTFKNTTLQHVNFHGAKFNNIEVSGAHFKGVIGLTKKQVDGMWACPENPPIGLEKYSPLRIKPD